jgi:hypothetical protein
LPRREYGDRVLCPTNWWECDFEVRRACPKDQRLFFRPRSQRIVCRDTKTQHSSTPPWNQFSVQSCPARETFACHSQSNYQSFPRIISRCRSLTHELNAVKVATGKHRENKLRRRVYLPFTDWVYAVFPSSHFSLQHFN